MTGECLERREEEETGRLLEKRNGGNWNVLVSEFCSRIPLPQRRRNAEAGPSEEGESELMSSENKEIYDLT